MRFNHDGVIGEINSLPGSSQVAIFHSVFVPFDQRGTGKGLRAHAKRLETAKELGYDFALCTVDMTNTAQLKVLSHFGWLQCGDFNSSKTGHTVGLFKKDL